MPTAPTPRPLPLLLLLQAHVERELMLIKVAAPPGPTRTEVTQIADIFRAHAVDVSEETLTLQVTGDVGKVG